MSIKLSHVTLSYENGVTPITDYSYTFECGVYSIVGASGSGKSTLLRGIAGLMKPISGIITYSPDVRISYVFQENRLVSAYTPLQNILLVSNDEGKARETLAKMKLDGTERMKITELSGGMQRRVAIARAICFGGNSILLDEPFTGLDDDLKATVANAIKTQYETIIISTHDVEDAELLNNGKGAVSQIVIGKDK